MKRSLRVLLSLVAAAALLGVMAGGAAARGSDVTGAGPDGPMAAMGVFRGRDLGKASAASSTNNLTYHGGPVQTAPAIYISFWGSEWNTGFSSGGYTSTQAQTYVTDFFTNVGGGAWNNVVTQYCSGVSFGDQYCPSGSAVITNPTGQLLLAHVWHDTTSVPRKPRQADIANAAKRLVAEYFGSTTPPGPNATFMVFTPTKKSMNGFGTSWCAWHSSTSSANGTIAYAYIPYMPDAGWHCGMNFVNAANDAYGHGYFDGFSVVAGHEYSEAETDPYPSSAWVDSSGAENADKCAWSSSSGNTTLANSQYYAVQPTWSNALPGCPTVN